MKIDREDITPLKSGLDLFRQKLYIIIYGVNTPAGKAFDISLLVVILLSVFTIMLETVEGLSIWVDESLNAGQQYIDVKRFLHEVVRITVFHDMASICMRRYH
ncbi:hypothetical protein SAMN06297358_1248 [Pedobacter xixiisoli]|uniref:Uncharacterized protein n=1 Tax=Pedobacter xixiisoli TaxID=1476464 RepID=A0A285ZVY8_9SPHI|nr:hypothetical protein SAMN06297358_1248 [Pedobacter xixiisoli]